MKKRLLSILLLFALCFTLMPAPVSAARDTIDAIKQTAQAQGVTLQYIGYINKSIALRAWPDKKADMVAQFSENDRVGIISVGTEWAYVITANAGSGYVLRQYCYDVTPISADVPLPYGAVIHQFTARVTTDTAIFSSPDLLGESYCTITAGSRISFWYMENGWAYVPYWRKIGYVHLSKLDSLEPATPTAQYATSGDILAVFTSFYSTKQTELNLGRMTNIDVSCKLISKVMQPGESFSFNGIAGPYNRGKGYQAAPVLINGTTAPGYGGGTCQVSTTLYNVLLQLPEGMKVTKRRPHGPSGAKYVPHGVDAAVGNTALDLVFTNAYDFPIRIDASAQDGALYIAILKE